MTSPTGSVEQTETYLEQEHREALENATADVRQWLKTELGVDSNQWHWNGEPERLMRTRWSGDEGRFFTGSVTVCGMIYHLGVARYYENGGLRYELQRVVKHRLILPDKRVRISRKRGLLEDLAKRVGEVEG